MRIWCMETHAKRAMAAAAKAVLVLRKTQALPFRAFYDWIQILPDGQTFIVHDACSGAKFRIDKHDVSTRLIMNDWRVCCRVGCCCTGNVASAGSNTGALKAPRYSDTIAFNAFMGTPALSLQVIDLYPKTFGRAIGSYDVTYASHARVLDYDVSESWVAVLLEDENTVSRLQVDIFPCVFVSKRVFRAETAKTRVSATLRLRSPVYRDFARVRVLDPASNCALVLACIQTTSGRFLTAVHVFNYETGKDSRSAYLAESVKPSVTYAVSADNNIAYIVTYPQSTGCVLNYVLLNTSPLQATSCALPECLVSLTVCASKPDRLFGLTADNTIATYGPAHAHVF